MDDIQKQQHRELQDELQGKIEAMIALVNDASVQIPSGMIPNLSTLERDVAALCGRVETCDSAVARAVQPFMGDLISRLDGLALDLQRFKERHQS